VLKATALAQIAAGLPDLAHVKAALERWPSDTITAVELVRLVVSAPQNPRDA
jgi:hypothetical protein